MNHGIISYVCRMKPIKLIASALLISACTPTSQPDNPGNTVENLIFTKVEILEAPGSGDSRGDITLDFSNDKGGSLHLETTSLTCCLEDGFYEITPDPKTPCQASMSGDRIYTGGILKVARKNEEYSIRARMTDADGNNTVAWYNGDIPFEWKESAASTFKEAYAEHKDLLIESEVLGMEIPYTVCIPPDYDKNKEYPVLYALHGMYGNNNDWFRSGNVNSSASWIAEETGVEMIIVSPYAMNTFYCDGVEDGLLYMTFFFDEFIPFIEDRYNVRSERSSRAIAGISMGGYGALYYGLVHPEMFCHVYACSPATYAGDSIPDLAAIVKDADPEALPGISVEIGTEDPLILTSGSFIRQMEKNAMAYEYITRAGMHEWPFWRTCTPNVVSKAARAYEKARSRD